MYYFVYLVTNNITGERYIGQHKTKKIDDGYLGSGKRIKSAIQEYGKDNFTREILQFANSKEEILELEKYYIRQYEADTSEDFYNITSGGLGTDGVKWDECRKNKFSEQKKQMYKEGKLFLPDVSGENNPMYGRKGVLSARYGVKLSIKEKEKLSIIAKQQYENGRIPTNLGHEWSDEVKNKIRESHRNKMTGKDNPNYGKGKQSGKCVLCLETQKEYSSIAEAAKANNCWPHQITSCCNHRRDNINGLHWEFVEHANTVPSSKEKV